MINEFISIFQPVITLLVIILLGHFVFGYMVLRRKYNQYPNSCETIFKPQKDTTKISIFESDDPWLHRINIPEMRTSPDLNNTFEAVHKLVADSDQESFKILV